ncbi:MAG: hypothetical protein WCT35_04925 [Sideroxydans sp.]|jgi:hypothetical protein
MTTTAQQTALESPVARVVYFAELHFVSGTLRLCTALQTINWGGYDWLGMGLVGSISPVEEGAGLTSSALNFTLNIADASVLALALGTVEDYRGQPAKLYFCPLDEQFRLIDTPEICWRGIMDTVAVGVDGETGQVTLKCETSAYGIKRRQPLRLNSAQQKQRHPGDTGFDFLNDLLARPQLWLSKKFQQI